MQASSNPVEMGLLKVGNGEKMHERRYSIEAKEITDCIICQEIGPRPHRHLRLST